MFLCQSLGCGTGSLLLRPQFSFHTELDDLQACVACLGGDKLSIVSCDLDGLVAKLSAMVEDLWVCVCVCVCVYVLCVYDVSVCV